MVVAAGQGKCEVIAPVRRNNKYQTCKFEFQSLSKLRDDDDNDEERRGFAVPDLLLPGGSQPKRETTETMGGADGGGRQQKCPHPVRRLRKCT